FCSPDSTFCVYCHYTDSITYFQPSAPSVAPPIAVALPVIRTTDSAISTLPLAPIQFISPSITPFYDPMLDEILKWLVTELSSEHSHQNYLYSKSDAR
ncbi:Hypothetical predicted protein, partial [Olea europaea subsp. europaea]